MEAGVDCLGYQVVNAVAEFVEEGDDFVVFQQTRFFLRGFGEIAYQCGGGIAFVSAGVDEALLDQHVTIYQNAGNLLAAG